jgi:rhodanese-related sulfurtransferase
VFALTRAAAGISAGLIAGAFWVAPAPAAENGRQVAQSQTKPAAEQTAKPRKTTPKQSAQQRPKKRVQPAAAPAEAQKPSTPATPAETADCSVETVAETGPVTYTVPIPVPGSKQRAAECLVPGARAVALAKKGELLIVDTRRESDFAQYRIPGSLNIQLSFVKTKAFLKDRAFALVNEGRSTAALENACRELRAAGFKRAGVLQGGLGGWRNAKGVVEGDLLAQRALTRMAPAEFAEEGGYGDWLVASVASVPPKELDKFLPRAVPLASGKDDSRFAAALKAAAAKRARKGVDLKVLVVDDDGSRIEKLESLVPAGTASQVVFLEGGLAGYRKFWTEQAAIWAALDRGPRRPRCGA